MPTVRDTINRALRKLRVLPSGGVATASEAADGLAVVQQMFNQWQAGGLFGRLGTLLSGNQAGTDVLDTTEGYAVEVLVWEALPSDPLVELPVRVRDPNSGLSVPPRDLSFTEVVYEANGTRKAYLYDARRGQWVRLDNLTLDSETPLAARGAEGMAACVAMKLAEEFGAEIGPLLVREAGEFKRNLSTRYGESRVDGTAAYF